MADTCSVRPLGLIRKLGIVVRGHHFDISTVVLALDDPGAYPILLGRPWLRSANIKQNWRHNCINFRRSCNKVRVSTQETAAPTKGITPLYTKDVNMPEGLDDTELEAYLAENPWIVPLFKIDIIKTVAEYAPPNTLHEAEYEPNPKSLMELSSTHTTFEREMKISRRVTASALEEVNIRTTAEPQLLSIAKDFVPSEKTTMIELLKEYKDVFAWSHEDMQGLDPKFYQHKINLSTDAKPVQ